MIHGIKGVEGIVVDCLESVIVKVRVKVNLVVVIHKELQLLSLFLLLLDTQLLPLIQGLCAAYSRKARPDPCLHSSYFYCRSLLQR